MTPWLFVRLAILAVFFVLNVRAGARPPMEGLDDAPPLLLGVFGLVAVPFLLLARPIRPGRPQWEYPSWRINPFNVFKPLQFFHFAGAFFIACASGTIAGDLAAGRPLANDAMAWTAFGIGILGGVHASTRLYPHRMVGASSAPANAQEAVMAVQLGEPTKKRNWVPWIVLAVALAMGLGLALTWTLKTLMKDSEAFKLGLQALEADAEAIALVGQPIEAGFPLGSISVTGPSGEANLSFGVEGPAGKGTVYVQATKSMGRWTTDRAEFAPDGTTRRIDLAD